MKASWVSGAAISFPAAVFCGVLAVAALPPGWLRGWLAPHSVQAAVPAPLAAAAMRDDLLAQPRLPCAVCGVVEQIRTVDNRGAAATYEFTVRMRDGSERTSVVDSADRWRAGDRIMLIGGAVRPAP